MKAGHEQYFRAMGFEKFEAAGGKLLIAAEQVFSPKTIDALLQNPVVATLFKTDNAIHAYANTCQTITTLVCQQLMECPDCSDLSKIFEQNSDHGWDHIRRTKKWKNWIDMKDPSLRGNFDYQYFQLAGFFSLRLHDIFQVYTGLKEGHDSAGALFAYGFILESYDVANDLISLGYGAIPKSDWEKQAWAAAFIIRHHSKPEDMPDEGSMIRDGFIDPKELLQDVRTIAKERGKTIYELFPPFVKIHEIIEKIDGAEMVRRPEFKMEELHAVWLQAHMVASADKLDSNFPSDLSSARTVLTRPNRPFYTRLEFSNGDATLDEEFWRRIADGSGHESSCDLNRILFELIRTEFMGKSPVISAAYARALVTRTSFFKVAIPKFLRGDISAYMVAYDRLVLREIRGLLGKVGLSQREIREATLISDRNVRHKCVRGLLERRGYHGSALDAVLLRIHQEKAAVAGFLRGKFADLKEQNLSGYEVESINSLFELAFRVQRANLQVAPGSTPKDIPPYENYFALDLKAWEK